MKINTVVDLYVKNIQDFFQDHSSQINRVINFHVNRLFSLTSSTIRIYYVKSIQDNFMKITLEINDYVENRQYFFQHRNSKIRRVIKFQNGRLVLFQQKVNRPIKQQHNSFRKKSK